MRLALIVALAWLAPSMAYACLDHYDDFFEHATVDQIIEECPPHARAENGNTPLHKVAEFTDNPNVVAALLDAGADVNARNKYGYTPLHNATLDGSPDVIAVLLDAGADVNARNEYGSTPLHWAAKFNNPEAIAALVDTGADVNARAENRWTPLHDAALDGSPDVIAVLLNAGADASLRSDDGRYPADLAKENEAIMGTDVYRRLHDAKFR